MTYEFAIHEQPAVDVLSIRDQVPADTFPAFLGVAFPELFGHIGRHGVAVIGHPFVIYHAFGPAVIDAEVCVPYAGAAPTDARIRSRELAATTIVQTLHVGPYEALGEAYAALAEWVDDHGYASAGPVRERYLFGVSDTADPADYRTELDQPVSVVPASVGVG